MEQFTRPTILLLDDWFNAKVAERDYLAGTPQHERRNAHPAHETRRKCETELFERLGEFDKLLEAAKCK